MGPKAGPLHVVCRYSGPEPKFGCDTLIVEVTPKLETPLPFSYPLMVLRHMFNLHVSPSRFCSVRVVRRVKLAGGPCRQQVPALSCRQDLQLGPQMVDESLGVRKLAGILPAPLCREQGWNNMRLAATASSLPRYRETLCESHVR